jgi:hypothetical protein
VGIEKIPRLRKLIANSETIGLLWNELWPLFREAHSDPIDEELIGQIYDYAWWCANSPNPDMHDIAILSFYPGLFTMCLNRYQTGFGLSTGAYFGL